MKGFLVEMVIDGEEFGGDLITWLWIGALIALCVLAISAVLLARLVHGKVTPGAVASGLVLTASTGVFCIVAWRLVGGDMTGYDGLWGLGAIAAGSLAWRSLRSATRRSNEAHQTVS